MNTDPFTLPPHSLEAERCAIAATILDRDIGNEILTMLRPDDFFLADHQAIFGVVSEMRRADLNIDAVLLKDHLQQGGVLERIGGMAYVVELLGRIPSAAHGPAYARQVKQFSALRQIITAATKAQRIAYEQAAGPEKIASDLMNAMLSVAATGAVDRIVTLADALEELRADLTEPGVVRRLQTGLQPFDDFLGGFPLGKFSIIGGRPGMGKSLVGKNLALSMAAQGIRCGLVSIEEDRQKIAENAAAYASGVDNRAINQNNFGNDGKQDFKRRLVLQGIEDLKHLPIFIADEPCRLEDVEAAVTAMKVRHQCEAVFVDHIHLIDAGEENANREVTKISRSLKACAKRLRVALVAMAQLNRGSEHAKERPKLKDLRDSGSLEQDADLVMFCYREDYYNRQTPGYAPNHILELLIEKNKDGVTGCIPLRVNLPSQKIEPLEADYNELV